MLPELHSKVYDTSSERVDLLSYWRYCCFFNEIIISELLSFSGSHRLISEYCTPRSKLQWVCPLLAKLAYFEWFVFSRKNYLKHAPCLNQVTRSGSGSPKNCVRSLKFALDIVPRLDFELRISAACCAYKIFLDCTEKVIEQKCGKEAIEFFSCECSEFLFFY